MAKQLSMENLVKKYQYIKTNQQNSETNPGLYNQEHSKSSPLLNDKTKTSARSMSSNALFESTSTSTEDSCKVCLDAEANCAFIECGHIVTCLNCAQLLTRCPVCRETIKRTLRIYKS